MDYPNWVPICVYAIGVMVTLGVYSRLHTEYGLQRQRRLLGVMITLVALGILADGFGMSQDIPGFPSWLVLGSTFVEFLITPAIGAAWYLYVRSLAPSEGRLSTRLVDVVVVVFTVLSVFLVISSPLTHWVYFHDSTLTYIRGLLWWAPFSLVYLTMLLVEVYVFYSRKRIDQSVWLALAFFPVPVLICALLQIPLFGHPWMLMGVSISLLIVFLNTQSYNINTDYLTGAFNRQYLDSRLEDMVTRAYHGHAFGGIMFDIDRFKDINDTFGHEVGDEALVQTAHVLRACVRRQDVIARYGGDEFVVLLEDMDDDGLREVIRRIDDQMAQATAGSGAFELRLSKGYAVFDPSRFSSVSQFMRVLDKLMYEDKERSRRAEANKTKGQALVS